MGGEGTGAGAGAGANKFSQCMKGGGPAWGEGAGGKINVRMDPSPSLLGSSVNNLECFVRKTKIEN